MRKLRDRLNKKGFTLVELIVVIVIVLILAAVLIPNVARYVERARKSAFQAEASSIFTEAQGLVADYYAVNEEDITGTIYNGGTFPEEDKLSMPKDDSKSDGSKLSVTFLDNSSSPYYTSTTDNHVPTAATSSSVSSGATIYLKDGVIEGFIYCDNHYYVGWPAGNTGKVAQKWTNVFDKN